MVSYEELGRKIGLKIAKPLCAMEDVLHRVDGKLHLFNHEIALGTDWIGLERKVVGETLRAVSLFTLPYIFSIVADPAVSSIVISSGIRQINSGIIGASYLLNEIHPLTNAAAYVKGIKGMAGGAITAAVGSWVGSDISHNLGITAMSAGASLFFWSSANYIERKR